MRRTSNAPPAVLLRAAVMTLALILIIWSSTGISVDKINAAFHALGIEPGAEGSPGLQPGGQPLQPGEERRTLCRTRIASFHFPDGRSIVEEKQGPRLEWLAEERQKDARGEETVLRRELSYIEMEKWLSRHCQYVVRPADATEASGLAIAPLVRVSFVDRSELSFGRAGEWIGEMEQGAFKGGRFKSPDLMAALDELKVLAQWLSPTPAPAPSSGAAEAPR
ncbi:MAG TPA: hypothetical protein PLZ57_13400 [Pseudobdellovibrionaceae bacterium]|nr:hypothetical protein [Pseudobdellovibrionaceae bacterium]